MMENFKIGDAVRLKTDEPDRLKLIVREINGDFLECSSECESRRVIAACSEFKLVEPPDPQADMKQAIREVLLSDEFMRAFAAAWMKTPIPMAHDVSFGSLEPGETLAGNYVWLGEATEARNDPT